MSPEDFVKLSPHRTHESNWLKALLCKAGWHSWYRLHFDASIQAREVTLCHWCPKVKVDGVLYDA